MKQIEVLSREDIDKIAAGEVVERPASVVKELVENAIDAGSNAVTVEIKDGGVTLIRVTDNGEGIPGDQIRTAFLRHATSKIRSVKDLETIGSLGFRGEALSSIAAVAQVELITKLKGELTGWRYCIDGGAEKEFQEIGAPEGSTFLIRHLFYNTPARKKFLKTAATEAGAVSDFIERLALSHPEVSFRFLLNGQEKLHTSGNGNLRDVIYSIFGREIAVNLIPVDREETTNAGTTLHLTGFIGKPLISRGNRNLETYFVNDRFVKSRIVAGGIEDGYKTFMMQHRYPFTVLSLKLSGGEVDVNVHPSKMEVRFEDGPGVYQFVYTAIKDALCGRDLIPRVSVGRESVQDRRESVQDRREPVQDRRDPEQENKEANLEKSEPVWESKEANPGKSEPVPENKEANPGKNEPVRESKEAIQNNQEVFGKKEYPDSSARMNPMQNPHLIPNLKNPEPFEKVRRTLLQESKSPYEPRYDYKKYEQMDLFENRLLVKEHRQDHKLIGQLFDTYWLVEFKEQLFIIDQHAAHEKVMYERLERSLKNRTFTSQAISPPILVGLSLKEEELLKQALPVFESIGFEISHFGGTDYAITAVPDNLFGFTDKALFTDLLDGLGETGKSINVDFINEKLATMACKSAVKGNHKLSFEEADALIRELLELENPYNCPHGRPTIIAMSKYELEKKFKRIV